ncbi:MAG: GGDEF domain-containing protein [Actinomycetota bacterium]
MSIDAVPSLPTAVLDAIPDAVLVKDAEARYVWVNEAFERLFHLTGDDVIGRRDGDVFPHRQSVRCDAGDLRVLATGEVDEVAETVHDPTFGARDLVVRKTRLTVDGQHFLVGIVHDVTDAVTVHRELERADRQLELQAEQLRRSATVDPLTGCLNRRALYDLGAELLDEDRPVGAVIMDLDHFKAINDTFGLGGGDAVLVRFADLLRACVRPDDLVARLGGEEFLVLLPGASLEETDAIAHRIRTMLADTTVDVDGRTIHCTVSIGAAHRASDLGLEKIIDEADRLLYRAKDHGRNRVVVG